MNVNCDGIGNQMFLALWTPEIRSNMVASFVQKVPSKVFKQHF